jgi:hypothetical protein
MQLLLKPNWFRSTLVTSLAKQYFADFSYDEDITLDEQFVETISGSLTSIKDYLGYIMLDFSLVDGALEQIPFGWAFQFAETIQLKDVFEAIVKKELQLSDKKMQQHKQKTMAAWYKIKEGAKEQVALEDDATA